MSLRSKPETARLFDPLKQRRGELGRQAACRIKSLNNTGICTFLAHLYGRTSEAHGDHSFANNLLSIKFKGILMKLKNVACAMSMDQLILQFFYVV